MKSILYMIFMSLLLIVILVATIWFTDNISIENLILNITGTDSSHQQNQQDQQDQSFKNFKIN